MRDDGRRGSMTVEEAEAVLAGYLPPFPPTRPQAQGERRLAAALIEDALGDADRPVACVRREEARAWLRDASALMSARACFEALGFDYDVVAGMLELRWRKVDAGEALPPLKVGRTL
jgi:hypothetical protein